MFRKAPAWVISLLVFVLALDVAFLWQRSLGVYQSEFGGHPDEPAHVVTGLFVRDALVETWRYAENGFHGSPIRVGKEFAEMYYTHYPKIGLGVWPPFFYLVQAAWTLPFGVSRTSLLILMCALAATLALLVFRALREEYSAVLSGAAAVALISLPLVRGYYGMVMAETLSAVLMFGATMAFGRFLDGEKRADAVWFGVLAALAILTKGTGLALALAAPLAVLLTRRWRLLKRPALWGAILIVAVFAGPWTWATRNLGKGGWLQPNPSWAFTCQAFPYYATKFGLGLGIVLFLLFAVGAFVKMFHLAPRPGHWAAAGALIVAVLVFQSIAPVGLEARHLIPILPAALMFAVAGFDFLARSLTGWRRLVLAAVILLGWGWTLPPHATKGSTGFLPLAELMLSDAAAGDVALVSSDATGEGMFIADVALHESRPGHVIQRASKSLSSSTWSGSGYTPAFSSDDQVYQFLTDGKIQYLVVDDALPADRRQEHHDQIRRVVEQHPDRFLAMAEADAWRGGEKQRTPVKLYKISRKN